MSSSGSEGGELVRIVGPVVTAAGMDDVRLNDVVLVGELQLIGEVIRLSGDLATIQVYEDTCGVRVGEPVLNTCRPLVAHLGPGLLSMVYDGLQRPLEVLASMTGDFLQRGVNASPLPQEFPWHFVPCVHVGEQVGPGDVLGVVAESPAIQHRIMVPPTLQGRVISIREGEFKTNRVVCSIEREGNYDKEIQDITLCQHWPVRLPRPTRSRLDPHEPLITGTRIIDAFFPVAKGGSAIIPGGFGTGKTVIEHSLAKWADVDIVVYVGCGERGNEMTAVLEELPKMEDPRTGARLMDRTVLIANTSSMPVAAREASIYTGITIAEYYRDMGYDVLMLADSTSRWGEALREISGRLEEMPGEEGYPAYLGVRLAEFYERAGRTRCLGRHPGSGGDAPACPNARIGSVTVVGAISPPGGDFSEPVTQSSMQIAGTLWALDYDLSRRRQFPAISWTHSYSLYDFADWSANHVAAEWRELTGEAIALLQHEAELRGIVQLVGPDALAEAERAVLTVARMLTEDFLQQSAYHRTDRFCRLDKVYWMLKAIMDFYHHTQTAIEKGVALEKIIQLPTVHDIARMRELEADLAVEQIKGLMARTRSSFVELGVI